MAVKTAKVRGGQDTRASTARQRRAADVRARGLLKGCQYFGLEERRVDVGRRLAGRRRRHGRRLRREHRAPGRVGAAVPAGRHRPRRRHRRDRRRARHQLPRRRLHGRLRPAVHGGGRAARRSSRALGLPGPGRHDDLRRRPQVRLRAQGHLGHRAPRQGQPAPADVRRPTAGSAAPTGRPASSAPSRADRSPPAWAVLQYLGVDGYVEKVAHRGPSAGAHGGWRARHPRAADPGRAGGDVARHRRATRRRRSPSIRSPSAPSSRGARLAPRPPGPARLAPRHHHADPGRRRLQGDRGVPRRAAIGGRPTSAPPRPPTGAPTTPRRSSGSGLSPGCGRRRG